MPDGGPEKTGVVEDRMGEAAHFDIDFQSSLRALFVLRRDVRAFETTPLPTAMLENLIEMVRLAPSVGLSEPWRFVIVDDPIRRAAIRTNFETCNAEALATYKPDRATHYARLKLSGLNHAPAHLAVFADRSTEQGYGIGRGTMPEMIEYSVVTAVHTLWLAARAQGIGMGWVSILDPAKVLEILALPADWKFIGYFCLGYPKCEDDTPELEREGWERRHAEQPIVLRR